MPTYTNGVLRLRPRLNVTRGYTGTEPGYITLSAPLDCSVTNASVGTTIYSGQPMELTTAGAFKKATIATAANLLYIAYHDSTDTDVDSCGKILGFSALGNFEIETAWAHSDSLAVGNELGVSAGANDNWIAKHGVDSTDTAVSGFGFVTEIRDLGVGGHVALGGSGVQRGGVSGTIPEDSTLTLSGGAQVEFDD